MVSLYNGSSRVCLGALDCVAVAEGVEDLEDGVLGHFEDLLHLDALQGNDPSWSLFIPVLEIVKAPIVENKPSSLPSSPLPALLLQPALVFGREECVHEIVVRFVRKLESFRLDASVDRLEHI